MDKARIHYQTREEELEQAVLKLNEALEQTLG